MFTKSEFPLYGNTKSKVRGRHLRANSTQIRGFHSSEKTFVHSSIYYSLSGANSAAEPHPSLRGNFLVGVVHKASLHMTAILSVQSAVGKQGCEHRITGNQ